MRGTVPHDSIENSRALRTVDFSVFLCRAEKLRAGRRLNCLKLPHGVYRWSLASCSDHGCCSFQSVDKTLSAQMWFGRPT